MYAYCLEHMFSNCSEWVDEILYRNWFGRRDSYLSSRAMEIVELELGRKKRISAHGCTGLNIQVERRRKSIFHSRVNRGKIYNTKRNKAIS